MKIMSENETNAVLEIQKPQRWLGVRHLQYVLLFTAAIIAYAIRIAFNVAVLSMVSDTSSSENVATYPEWSGMKNTMLSAFFWSYGFTQIISAQLSEKLGPKWFLAGTFCIGSLFSVLIPIFGQELGYQGIIACRVIQGLTQGFIFPCVQNLLSHWGPVNERAKACSFVYSGVPLGTVISMPITGFLCDAKNVGWPGPFYVFGALGIFWTVLWMFLGANSPSQCKYISAEEKNYILSTLSRNDEDKTKVPPTPWLSIIKSLPFWSIIISDIGHSWGYWTLLSEIPSYMQNMLNFDITANGLLSALPYVAYWLLTVLMGIIADYLLINNYITTGTSRKLFNSIAMFVPAVALMILSFIQTTDRVLIIALLVISVGSGGGSFCGFITNSLDIAPNYSGTLLGISNTLSTISALLTPLFLDITMNISGYHEGDEELWNIVFCTSAIICIVTGLFYVFAASGEIQPWNNPEVRKRNSSKMEESNTNYEKLEK